MLQWSSLWSLIEPVPGWLTENEAKTLYELARTSASPFVAVELGSYKGRSTMALAGGLSARTTDGGAKLLAVDLWMENGRSILQEHVDALAMQGLSWELERRCTDTARAAELMVGECVGLLFIDADHSYEAVRRDFESWSCHVRPGGYVAFHDSWADGPSRVIAQLPGWYEKIDHQDSLSVFRKRMP